MDENRVEEGDIGEGKGLEEGGGCGGGEDGSEVGADGEEGVVVTVGDGVGDGGEHFGSILAESNEFEGGGVEG